MTEVSALYQDLIVDHARRPRNYAFPPASNLHAEGHNPLCGDQLTVEARERDGVLEAVGFQGQGCALCLASASTMTECVQGKKVAEIERIYSAFHSLVTTGKSEATLPPKLGAFAGVSDFPMRVKCTTLAWHTLRAAIHGERRTSTEE